MVLRGSMALRRVPPGENALRFQLDRDKLKRFVTDVFRLVLQRLEVNHFSYASRWTPTGRRT